MQQHASTAWQLRVLKAQLLLNGGRDFLSQLFPVLRAQPEGREPETSPDTPVSPPPSARRFTFGQLALIAWQLEERWSAGERCAEVAGHDVDLRALTSAELSRHLTTLGA